jgi:hypothetical protein
VVVLGVVEGTQRDDLGGDVTAAGLRELGLEEVARGLRDLALAIVGDVHTGAVLRADVVALAHPLRRVVVLPEELEDRLEARGRGIPDDQHDLVVARPRRAHLFVGRVRRLPARVADGGRPHARRLPEDALGAPEAAHPDHERLEALGPRRRGRVAQDDMLSRRGDRVLAARQGLPGLRHGRLVAAEEHASV